MSNPDPDPVFLRELWWQDATYDGSPVDDGDASQAGFPFADQAAQAIVPRTLRNFAYEIARALQTNADWIVSSPDLLQSLQFYIGDGVAGDDGNLYWTTVVPTPPTSPIMADWNDAGQVEGVGIAKVDYNTATNELTFTMTDGTVQGPFDISGARGSVWLTGLGPPDPTATAPDGSPLQPGDFWLATDTGDVYEFLP